MRALQGQTVAQWPQETQLDSTDRDAAIPEDAGMRIGPVDRERFVDLDVLAGLDAAAAEDALLRVVAIERVGHVDLVRLFLVRDRLVLDGQHLHGVVDRAVAVVVVADGAVEDVIGQKDVERLDLRCFGARSCRVHGHAVGHGRAAGADELAVALDQAGVAGLDRAELGMVADVGDLGAHAFDHIDEPFAGLGVAEDAVDRDVHFVWTVPERNQVHLAPGFRGGFDTIAAEVGRWRG